METFSEKIISDLSQLHADISEYLTTHSSIKRRIFPGDSFISMSGDYGFEPLQADAIPVQDRLYKRFNRIVEIISVLLVETLEKHIDNFEQFKRKVAATICQNEFTWNKNIQEEVSALQNNFEELKSLIKNIYPESLNEPIIVPDTNALYTNTEMENWSFNEFQKFTIALTPSVLSDLDKHKIEHRNETVRNKANKLINKLKEYRRRGKLTEKIYIVKGKICLFTIATEPNFSKTLSCLDRDNGDDRLIAEMLEIIRKFADRPVFLVTSDINLQNKCEVADLIFYEPPTPN